MRSNNFLAILILVIVILVLFHKFFLNGLLPFPGDLLVSFYFPWNSGGFPAFDPWVNRKGVIAMDVIRQIYPWKTLAFELIKQGQLPLWNPYNFSGSPLLANLQSSVFFPGSLLFFALPNLPAWIAQVIMLPLFLSVFSYIFLRSLNLSKTASLFGAIAMANISYITVWAEQLIIIQSTLFLPLILYLINKKKFLWAAPLFALSFFGGHLQTTAYVFAIAFFYAIFKKTPLREIILIFILSIALSSIQLIPSLELYQLSARETIQSRNLFQSSAFPWQNLITIFAPDFFGNPAVNNFRGMDYGNFQGFFGIVALVLSLVAAVNFRKNKTVLFFLLLGTFGLIFSLWPFAMVFEFLKVPILSSGYPSRLIFVFQFSFAILSAFGLNFLLNGERSKVNKVLGLIGLIYLICLIVSFVLPEPHWQITRNNLILPTGLFLVTGAIIVGANLLPRKILLCLIILAIFDYAYFFNKYQPFAKSEFVFPSHPVFKYIQKNNGLNRFYGIDRAYIDNNFATEYRVYSPEGYDPLYIARMGELLAASEPVQRSDALLPRSDGVAKQQLLDLLGVKLIIDKTDDPINDQGADPERLDPKLFVFKKQYSKWKFYQNKNTLPRAFVPENYQVETDSKKLLKKIYDPKTNFRKTVFLESKIDGVEQNTKGSAKIISYTPNNVVIEAMANKNGLLFLSDSFYPGWKAVVNGNAEKINRANYAFRAIPISKGKNLVTITYEPQTLKIGFIITIIGLILWIFVIVRNAKKSAITQKRI